VGRKLKNIQNITACGWLILMVFVIIYLFTVTIDQISVETNILKLLPTEDRDPLLEKTIERFSDRIGNRLIFLVSGEDEKTTVLAARQLVSQLSQTEHFQTIQGAISQDQQQSIVKSFFPHRYTLLSEEINEILDLPNPVESLIQRMHSILYSPASFRVGKMLEQDPLLIFYSWIQQLSASTGNTSLTEGFVSYHSDNKIELLVSVRTKLDPFATDVQIQITRTLTNIFSLVQKNHQSVNVIYTGVLPFAHRAEKEARRELSFIGGISMIGVVFLIWISFRSFRQLLIGIIPIAIGVLCSIVISVAISPTLHLITMVFGGSMIGICIDYSFHYFSVHLASEVELNLKSPIQQILPGISLGLLTSLLGYLGFFFTPLPGLRQIAIFSATGLTTAYLTVIFWFPVLMKNPVTSRHQPLLLRFSQSIIKFWIQQKRVYKIRILVLSLLPILIFALSITLVVDDDIRRLQHQPKDLLENDKHIQSLTGNFDISRFLLIHAASTDKLMQTQQQVLQSLKKLQLNKQISGFRALAAILPGFDQQQKNQQKFINLITKNEGILHQSFSDLGFSTDTLDRLKNDLHEKSTFSLAQWLKSSLGQLESDLWIGDINGQVVSLVLLKGIKDEQSLREINQTGVKYVNKVEQYSTLMGNYRKQAIWMISCAYLLIFLLLIFRYHLKNALFVIAAPAFATLTTLLIFSLFQMSINLIHILSMLLVLGISIDYSIFMMESENHAEATMMAILLSGITTILSFGALCISNMPAIRDIGIFISIGINISIWISPIALNIPHPFKQHNKVR
jgi:predicted exporter